MNKYVLFDELHLIIRVPADLDELSQRLSLAPPQHGIAQFYSGESEGLIVQLPGWQYAVVIDTLSGVVHFDNFENHWGAQEWTSPRVVATAQTGAQ